MREQVLRSVQVLTNPIMAGILAMIIVLVAGAFAANRMGRPMYDIPLKGGVEMVRVKRAPIAQAAQPNTLSNTAAAPSVLSPQIARTAKISLYVASVDAAASTVTRIAKRNGGDVFSSDISNGDGSTAQPSGDMEIRVPAERFDSAMASLMAAGTVREHSTSAQDLTGSITDSDARLRNLRRTEADIRAIMDRSGSVSQIMDAENQLSQVREQIETLESQLKEMRGQVAYATIDIDLQAEAKTAPVSPTASSQLISSWHDAVASLGAVTMSLMAAVLWFVVFIPYLLLAAGAGWFIYVRARRRAAL